MLTDSVSVRWKTARESPGWSWKLWMSLVLSVTGTTRPGNGQDISQSQGTTPQQHRVLQQLQQGDWRLQQLHHLQHQPAMQNAYIQQVQSELLDRCWRLIVCVHNPWDHSTILFLLPVLFQLKQLLFLLVFAFLCFPFLCFSLFLHWPCNVCLKSCLPCAVFLQFDPEFLLAWHYHCDFKALPVCKGAWDKW